MFKASFGIELKDKTLVCQKPYPESFDSIPYSQFFKVPEFIKFTGRIVGLHESMLVSSMHK